jgi:hypothetical protein
MAKYHINSEGNAGVCHAQGGNCPFASDDEHYSTPEEARIGYESQMDQDLTKAFSKLSPGAKKELTGMLEGLEKKSKVGKAKTVRFDGQPDDAKDYLPIPGSRIITFNADSLVTASAQDQAIKGAIENSKQKGNWSHKNMVNDVNSLYADVKKAKHPDAREIRAHLAKSLAHGIGVERIKSYYPKIAKDFSSQDVSNMTASWNDSKKQKFFKSFPEAGQIEKPRLVPRTDSSGSVYTMLPNKGGKR